MEIYLFIIIENFWIDISSLQFDVLIQITNIKPDDEVKSSKYIVKINITLLNLPCWKYKYAININLKQTSNTTKIQDYYLVMSVS